MNGYRSLVGGALASRVAKHGWSLAGVTLCALVFSTLPSAQIRLGQEQLRGLVGTYLYAHHEQLDVVHPWISEINLPRHIRLEWEPSSIPGVFYRVKRNNTEVVSFTTATHWDDTVQVDTADLTDGLSIDYAVQILVDPTPDWALPDPGEGAPEEEIFNTAWTPSEYEHLKVKVKLVEADENQTVDSRIDKRYSTTVYQDFKFGSRTYGGGLYVGKAPDSSRVGRTFVRWAPPTWPDAWHYFAGSANLFHNSNFTAGSVTVAAQLIDSDWDGATMKWTNQPSCTPGSGYTVAVEEGGWAYWRWNDAIGSALIEQEPLSLALTKSNESTTGWAYFMKKEAMAGYGPKIAVAYHYPGTAPAPSDLTATPVTGMGHAIDLEWVENTHALGAHYVIQRKTGARAWENIGDSSWAPVTQYRDNSVTADVTYTYRLKYGGYFSAPYYSGEATATAP